MKVTAILPDRLVADVRAIAGGRNLTDCLIRALEEWIRMRKIRDLNARIEKDPLQFLPGATAESLRRINRSR
jgi:hypothetical protein